ncbi:amidase [Pelagibius sp.]|uniref:amidase n=1 Tax=Pelagibius sp. TaxID=1931238 RepID=UPI002623611A|nr:amidase [Pelagibius sp.]
MLSESDRSLAGLRRALDSGALTARALAESYITRIEDLDHKTKAVIELNPRALDDAEALDTSLSHGAVKGPLHGIPVMVKDNLNTAAPMTTTAGSLALEGLTVREDATVVARLRAAGAVILGKTNLSEWANFRSARSSSGWSSRGGQTRNPYALDRTPGGSSSGSGVAVAAGYCAAAIGTETDGSIVSPAAMNGVVGIKPTVGLISRRGIIPVSHSQDTAGPMARSVADAALVLGVVAGSDAGDPATAEADRRGSRDYTACLDPGGLKGAKIGCLPGLAAIHAGAAAILDGNLQAIREAGAEIVHDIALPEAEAVRPFEMKVLTTEFKAGLNAYLAEFAADGAPKDLRALIARNEAHREQVMPYFPQDLLEKAEATAGLDDPIYRNARRDCLQLIREEGIDRVMAERELDALVVPTTCAPWLIDWVNGDNRSGSSAYLAAVSGYPSITVPAGYLFGLPIGLSFIARAYEEAVLIRFAFAFEQATKVRIPPPFAKTANLQPCPSPPGD